MVRAWHCVVVLCRLVIVLSAFSNKASTTLLHNTLLYKSFHTPHLSSNYNIFTIIGHPSRLRAASPQSRLQPPFISAVVLTTVGLPSNPYTTVVLTTVVNQLICNPPTWAIPCLHVHRHLHVVGLALSSKTQVPKMLYSGTFLRKLWG